MSEEKRTEYEKKTIELKASIRSLELEIEQFEKDKEGCDRGHGSMVIMYVILSD